MFTADPCAAVLRVLEEAGTPLTAGEVKHVLRAARVPRAEADRAWPGVRNRIRAHEHVIVEADRYTWTPQPRGIAGVEALELLAAGRLDAATRAWLLDAARAALTGTGPGPEAAARHRQSQIDGVRALAELAIEVEELTANAASSAAMVHRVRARVRRTGLEPVERAGEQTTFDRRRHQSIGRPIRDGAAVVVVRPGYVWKAAGEDVLIAKAVVEDEGRA